jgi:uncharacterized protein YbcI
MHEIAYISLSVRNALVHHGYAEDHSEIIQEVTGQEFAEKVIRLDRILSVTEQYLLVSGSHGRVMYWEYEGTLADIKVRLAAVNRLIH